MKKIKGLFLFALLFVPFIIKANVNYEDAINYANKFLESSVYSDHSAYLLQGKDRLYEDDRLINSGFLSKKEYDITNFNNGSYLAPGIEYWTSTLFTEGQRHAINYKIISKNETDLSGVRVTQHINPGASVTGAGTKTNPWVFVKQYNLILSSNQYGSVSPLKQYVANGSDAVVNLYPLFGYEYVSNTCEKDTGIEYITKKVATGFEFIVKNMNKNLICDIKFGPKSYEFNLYDSLSTTQANPQKIKLVYANGWYNGNTEITKVTPPKRTGYIFGGYSYDGTNTIDASGNILSGNEKIIDTEKTSYEMEAKWTAIKYKVAYNGNSATSGSMATTEHTYDVSYNLSSNTFVRTGYKFNGWNTESDGSGTSYTGGATFKNLTTTNNQTITLYAQWKPYKLTVKFNANGANITSSTVSSGTTYYWQLDSSKLIKRSTDNSTYTDSFYVKNYDASVDLPNWNNSTYLNLTKQGYKAKSGAEWCTASNGTGTCFNHATAYTTENLCSNIKTGDCSVTLYLNLVVDKITYTMLSNSYSCKNKTVGSAPYIVKYTGNCSIHKDNTDDWRVKFLTSGTLTLGQTTNLDVFLVGGGGGGNTTSSGVGGAGGGGYTKTVKNISLSTSAYTVTIGAGGGRAATGGTSSIKLGSSVVSGLSAAGGKGGGAPAYNTRGGAGGSGGGGWSDANEGTPKCPGRFGTSGSYSGGGQGTTTCEFGQGTTSKCNSGVTEYSGGGCCGCCCTPGGGGGSCSGGSGKANTGGGGGAYFQSTGSGGSGIVIIRNKR